MNSNKKLFNYKVVLLFKIYNIYFDHFFIWQKSKLICSQIKHLSLIVYETIRFIKNIRITISDEQMTKQLK